MGVADTIVCVVGDGVEVGITVVMVDSPFYLNEWIVISFGTFSYIGAL